MLGSVTLDLDPIDRGHSTVGGLAPRQYCVGSGGPPARVAQGSLVVLKGTQIPYPIAVDLMEGYEVSQVGKRPRKRPRLAEEDLVVVFPDKYGMLRISYNFKLKVSTPNFSLDRTYPWFRKMSGPHSPNHENQAMPESSSHGPTNIASHEIIGNFMTKMTELLQVTLANRRGEWAQNTSSDEALEQVLRFRPPEFHCEVEQEAKVELFLEHSEILVVKDFQSLSIEKLIMDMG
ncbi:hypothetical protein M9H77_30495 [Catharanthus roseus]|uniref:Uncharacterized protein n=1 Tax=Catharanthus roseus TaxID=4058 RepID=A0ACB9ZXE6_CATRO|nr:hypothetical protein M9H77_30495 [Catharanthus roseus]